MADFVRLSDFPKQLRTTAVFRQVYFAKPFGTPRNIAESFANYFVNYSLVSYNFYVWFWMEMSFGLSECASKRNIWQEHCNASITSINIFDSTVSYQIYATTIFPKRKMIRKVSAPWRPRVKRTHSFVDPRFFESIVTTCRSAGQTLIFTFVRYLINRSALRS